MNKSENYRKICSHIGHWGMLGVTTLSTQKDVQIFHNLFCKKCGESEVKLVKTIDLPKVPVQGLPSGIAIPKMVMRKKPSN